jgi:hypothetical protein
MVRLKEIQSENKQPIVSPEQNQAKIISCEVKNRKIIFQLDDGREVSVSVNLLIK